MHVFTNRLYDLKFLNTLSRKNHKKTQFFEMISYWLKCVSLNPSPFKSSFSSFSPKLYFLDLNL